MPFNIHFIIRLPIFLLAFFSVTVPVNAQTNDAPQPEMRRRGSATEEIKEEQWPYQIKPTGTSLDDSVITPKG